MREWCGNCKKWLMLKNKLQKNKGHQRTSLSLFASYLIILAAPTVAIIIVYFMARSALLDVQKERAHRLLSESVITLSQKMDEIKNVSTFVAGNNKLSDFQKDSYKMTKEQKFYELYLLTRSYPDYPMVNQAIGNIYILVKDIGYIVQLPAIVPDTKAGRDSLTAFQEDSWDKLIDGFGEKYIYGEYFCFTNHKKFGNDSEIALVRSLPKATEQSKEGVIVITLDKKSLDELLEHALLDTRGVALILDENDEIIRSVGGKSDGKGEKWSEYENTNKLRQKYYVDSLLLDYNGWKFITATPKGALLSKIDTIKYIMIVLCLISVGIGVLICFMYWYRRRSMVQRYLVCVEGMEGNRETESFWGSLNHFLDNVENLQTTVTRQQRIVQKEILRKLLYGNYDSIEELETDICREEKVLYEAGHYYVVRLEMRDTSGENLYGSKIALAEDVRFHFAKYMNFVHWIYGMSHLSYAIIISHQGDLTAEDVKEEFAKWNYLLYKDNGISIFTGISCSISYIMHMPSAFEEASGIVEYAGFMGIHVPLLKGDIPERNTDVVFSIDMEMQLEQAIKNGTEEGLEKLLKDIGEYYLNCFQEYSIMQHMLEILRCTVIRSLEKGKKGDQSDQIRKDVHKAQRPEEIFEIIRRAKQYYQGSKKEIKNEEQLLMKSCLEEIIDREYRNPGFNLAILSAETGVPERKLYKDFKEYFGISFSEYVERIRIHNACDCLRKGMAVKEVAESAGYGSEYSFRRAFKRVTGLAPSQFKKAL